MTTVKRLGLAAALGVSLTLLATSPVRAGDTYELLNVCVSGDQDADATGQVTFGAWKWQKLRTPDGEIITWVESKVTIKCWNLTPDATYETTAGTLTADRNGNGTAVRIVGAPFPPPGMDAFVYRVNSDGSSTLVLGWWWGGGP